MHCRRIRGLYFCLLTISRLMSQVGVVLVGRARGPESLPRCVCRAPVLGRVPRGPGFRPELRATSGECALGSTSAGCVTPAGQGGCEVTERARERALRRAARGWPRRLPRLCLAWPRACRARCRRRPPVGRGAAPPRRQRGSMHKRLLQVGTVRTSVFILGVTHWRSRGSAAKLVRRVGWRSGREGRACFGARGTPPGAPEP